MKYSKTRPKCHQKNVCHNMRGRIFGKKMINDRCLSRRLLIIFEKADYFWDRRDMIDMIIRSNEQANFKFDVKAKTKN